MRNILLAAITLSFCISCSKDKYTTAPQIKFKSITPSVLNTPGPPSSGPKLTIEVTDAEGDFGFKPGEDTSYVFVKNLTVPPFKLDSFKFPAALAGATGKNFKGDVEISISGDGTAGSGVLAGSCSTSNCTDTLYFEVYVIDFAKNKSNVIKTEKPLLFIRP